MCAALMARSKDPAHSGREKIVAARPLLKSSGLRDVLRPVLVLLGIVVVVNALAVWRYRKISG